MQSSKLVPFPVRALVAVAVLTVFSGRAGGQTKLLRFPDIQGESVVFCHGGDLWKAGAEGGVAVRLTAHPGQELFPKFSPDGGWIAFTGQYDGDEHVYVIPAEGGVPKQLTFYPATGPQAPRHGVDNQVYGWTPDGSRILFRSVQDADRGAVRTALYTVAREGGLPVKLPMPTAGAGDFSPDGKHVVYAPLFRDFRTWKRYHGGWAQNLYVFDLATHAVRLIAESPRTERDPMWIGQRIYFVSDRTGTLNLYACDAAGGEVEALTRSERWDVRWASSDNRSRIVYELDGELEVYDTVARRSRRLAIRVPDDGLSARPSRYLAARNIESFGLSPGGERALFVARGDVFTAPVEKGAVRNLTESSGAHDKHAAWSPDGARVAFISDHSGEEQVYVVDQDGGGKPERLTEGHAAMLDAPVWSPDGKRLAYGDKDGRLYLLTVESRRVQEIADARRGTIQDPVWAPGSGQLAFSMAESNGHGAIYVWDVEDKQLHRVTDPLWDSGSPAWDAEGNYLLYVSRREFTPQISDVEWNFAGNRSMSIFALALRKDVPNPFAPESDEVKVRKPGEKADGEDKVPEKDGKAGSDGKARVTAPLRIDYEGLAARVARVPVPADNIVDLRAVKGHLLFRTVGGGFYGRESYEKSRLHIFAFKEREASVLVADAGGFAVSQDGLKVLVQEQAQYRLYDAKPKAKDPKTVATSELYVNRVPAQEWAQIYDEVWRRFRDFFYVRNMHGYDWPALREQYRPWVAHVAHRSDLNYVLGELVSELNVGHAYIESGDFLIPERPRYGLPGARFELDAKAGRYRIAQIFPGHNEEEKYRSPLTEIGVDVRVGDYVLQIDGEELIANDNPYRLLRHKTQPVTWMVHSKPTLKGARRVTYRPVSSEANLVYLDWIEKNRRRVDALTGGQAGYLHLPNMGAEGIYEFIKWFYPQIRKSGLVVDVRGNGGGNVSQWIIERLDNKLLGTRFGYHTDAEPGTYPEVVFHGHMVCLINETSASDGDIFPHRFRQAGLGPLIGRRTWGGVVGISSRGPLIDGGEVFVPLNATNDPEGRWIIEGEGVHPDMDVENDPASVIAGRDLQLERGVEELLKRMREQPRRLPNRPPDPVKVR